MIYIVTIIQSIIIIVLIVFYFQSIKEAKEIQDDYIEQLIKLNKQVSDEQNIRDLSRKTINENHNGSITNLINKIETTLKEVDKK